jgi:hypothetical protein
MDGPWTTLRVAHRPPTPLTTGSTLDPHTHPLIRIIQDLNF